MLCISSFWFVVLCFKQKTAYEMRISDWSSDVCSSDLAVTTHLGLGGTIDTTINEHYELARQFASLDHLSGGRAAWNLVTSSDAFTGENFRRGGDRKSVVEGKGVSVSVDLGGCRIIKKKKTKAEAKKKDQKV